MRILIYGNTNNLSMQIASALRGEGHDLFVVFNQTAVLHSPRALRRAWSVRLPKWVIDHTHLGERDYIEETEALRRACGALPRDIDFVLLTDMGGAVLPFFEAPHGFIAAGSDVSYYGSTDLASWRAASWSTAYRESESGAAEIRKINSFVARQRNALGRARFIIIGPRGHHPAADTILDQIGFVDERRHYWRVADPSRWNAFVYKPRRRSTIITVGARIDFLARSSTSQMDNKGTDVLLRGIAQSGLRAEVEIRLPRKGHDVGEAERLVERLGLGDQVRWYPELSHRAFRRLLGSSDIVCDSLGPSGPAGVTHDALASGRIVIANLQPDVWTPVLGAPYPGFHATQPDDVVRALASFRNDPDTARAMREEARSFAETVLSARNAAQRLSQRIEREAR